MNTSGLPGFECRRLTANGIELSVHLGGGGPPLLLLHGYPQNHMCWARVAPELARRFRCIVPDLRGYGGSDAPADDEQHTLYAKRTMAEDMVGLLDALGLQAAAVVGHDRGARVAYRLALDHPQRVRLLGVLEIVPTGDFWAAWNADLALKAYHWTFLAQPPPLPERLIGADPVGYMDWTLAGWTRNGSLDAFPPESLESYRAQARQPRRIAAMCADYRAGAGMDRRLDEADRDAGRRIAAPVHFLWAEGGFPARTGDPLGLWRRWADRVTGQAIAGSGHFMLEEQPEAVLRALLPALERVG